MKVAIIGRTEQLYATAEKLSAAGHEIKVIVTAKEAPEYTKGSDDFKALAESLGALFIHSPNINAPENIAAIKAQGPIDVGISMNYVNVISQEVVDLFPVGLLNAHCADLPLYRGNACQAWAIINGEERIGLCVHQMVGDELDNGDIITRDFLPLDINTKVTEIMDWMNTRIPELHAEAIEKLAVDPTYVLEVQSTNPEDILRGYPRRPEDGRIDWSADRETVLRLINASNHPFAGAFCDYEGEKLIIWDAELYDDDERYLAIPGQVASVERDSGSIIIITGKGKLRIKEIEINGNVCPPAQVIKSIRKRLG